MKVLGVAIPGCFFGGAMDGSMIGLVTPLFKPLVESAQREGGRKKGEKLHSECFEIPHDFSFPFGTVRGAVNQRDAERGDGVSELVGAERRAIVEIMLGFELWEDNSGPLSLCLMSMN